MSGRRSALRDRVEYAAYRALRAAGGVLGPRPLAALGAAAGDLFRMIGGRRRRIIRFNLALAFPELSIADRRRLEREAARHLGRVALDALRIQRLGPDELLGDLTVTGREHVAAAAALGRGILYFSGHVGSWEVAALSIGLLFPESVKVVNRPLDNPFLERELAGLRGRFGNLPLGKTNVARGILRQLKDRGAVGIMIDQRVPPEVGIEVPFFGHPAATHPILARIVRRTRAPVVPIFALWDRPGHYTVRYLAPLVADEMAEDELEDAPFLARCTAILEEVVRERPEQWLWYHDRWRHLRLAGQS